MKKLQNKRFNFILALALAIVVGGLLIVALPLIKWRNEYVAALAASHLDYNKTHSPFGVPGSVEYLALGVICGDDEVTVDMKLFRSTSISGHLSDVTNPHAAGFTKKYVTVYGPKLVNPDGSNNELIVETFFADFDDAQRAFAIRRSLFCADAEKSESQVIDLCKRKVSQ